MSPLSKCDIFGWLGNSSGSIAIGLPFWEASKRVVESNFHHFLGVEFIGLSGHHSNLVVETLDGAGGDLPLWQGVDSAAGCRGRAASGESAKTPPGNSRAPAVEEGLGPEWRSGLPEMGDGPRQFPIVGARLVICARRYCLLLADHHLAWRLLGPVLRRIDALPLPAE